MFCSHIFLILKNIDLEKCLHVNFCHIVLTRIDTSGRYTIFMYNCVSWFEKFGLFSTCYLFKEEQFPYFFFILFKCPSDSTRVDFLPWDCLDLHSGFGVTMLLIPWLWKQCLVDIFHRGMLYRLWWWRHRLWWWSCMLWWWRYRLWWCSIGSDDGDSGSDDGDAGSDDGVADFDDTLQALMMEMPFSWARVLELSLKAAPH